MTATAHDALLVFDTTVLHHFTLADRLDVLADLVAGQRVATTAVVLDELRTNSERERALTAALELDWVNVIPLDTITELSCFAAWVRRIGAGRRDLGEASVFAAAEIYRGTAVTDDRTATKVGRRYGLEVHGTIWLLAERCRSGRLTEVNAGAIIDALGETQHRLPCTGAEFSSYARKAGILPLPSAHIPGPTRPPNAASVRVQD
ncbi:hypothetical protein [Micromonospora sp. WMMC250]|uniref:hypothetical protein n=1 Tax=Micromonospora sp. WMMC250 TaxID=3014781 RepID=UPI0022B60E7F|nr:hypothetical protein [Micromonospora sp. WMMC250]MCZ7376675.1 hypothetical protein [Micromonospora sp. WMMC250]